MPFLFAVTLIVIVHLATGLGAWFGVGLLSDDHEMIVDELTATQSGPKEPE